MTRRGTTADGPGVSELHPSVVAALARICRAEGDAGALRAFTVARTEAVLRLRELPRPGAWHFTLPLVRAANAVALRARGFAREHDDGEARVLTLAFSTAGFDYAGVDLRGLVLAAADGDSDMSEETEHAAGFPASLWRRLVGAGVNEALAGGPMAVEVRTAAGAVRYVRKDSHAAGQDPYAEQRAEGRCPPQAFEVEVRWPRPGFGRRLTSWLARQAGAEAALTELWLAALPGAEPDQTASKGIELGRPLPGMKVSLGTADAPVGTWGWEPELGGPWLVREGVRLVSLAQALTRLGLTPGEFAGWIECPGVRLTADEASVALDAGCELLAAWLLDARAHSFPGEYGQFVVQWPSELRHVPTLSGRPAPIEQVIQRCRQGRDLVYAWPHHAESVPASIRARVFALWPSELALLRAAIPEARLVPARALGETPQFERADLSDLYKSALYAIQVDLGVEATASTSAGARLRIELEAFVHRFASAEEGTIALLFHERRVAHVREAGRTIAGVTLVAKLIGEAAEALTIDGLRAEKELLNAIAERCRAAALRAIDRLLAPALAHKSPWELPLVRAQAGALTGAALGVRYRQAAGGEAAELAWDESQLLALAVGHDMAGQTVTLQQALVRCRNVGGIVVEDPKQRWTTFRSPDPRHEPWALSREGRALIERVAGEPVLWDMPTVAEGHLQPAAAGEQQRLVLGAGAIAQAISTPRPPWARADLRAHLLVAEALGQAAPEVVDMPLWARYDPRTLEPVRTVSRSDARAEGLGLLPPGSSTRALAGPVLLVTPGEARLLHAAGHPLAAAAAATTAMPATRTSRAPLRRAGAAPTSLAVLPVADALYLGALRVEGRPSKIAVWGGGLHINDLDLPPPLDWIGGRLTLTREGARAGSERLAAQVKGLAREVVRTALRERLLHAPGSPQRAGLDAFRERCAAPESPVAEYMRERPGLDGHALADMCAASLKQHPLRRLAPGPRRLEGLLRQALTRPLAVEGAILSWQAARLGNVEGRAWSIELGRRNAEIQRALADDASNDALFAAAALALAQVFAEARQRGLQGAGLPDELVAGYRVLALLYAHVP
ncbi:hypothetical protein [Nannocystis sp. SCPEA4]|uniref:hypothetical protein n=1 Tax=Nannocystis sp. SCPEA4 TaxID=2996787 RepID=UPI002271F322|nr:hypothetical protein [Nannocystis sp. SCPEA4]MCY1061288.1 hypothetical protein [Nannocystis sp. SCPEA4]